MHAAGYVRVSTQGQAREGYSLAAQEEAIRSYCKAQGWELAEIYGDPGRSGGTTRGRDDLARLVQDAKAGCFQRVVFWRLDRLARNLRDFLQVCDQLEAAGVGIVSIQQAIDTGTPTGRMIRNVFAIFAEFEREVTVERIVAGLAQKARGGKLVGPLPLGYRRDGSGAVVLSDQVAPLVREAFARYRTGGYSLRQMADWAAAVGLRSSRGRPLDRLSVRKMLTNVTYTGQVAYHGRRGGGVVAQGNHPPIVDAETFNQVQRTLANRRRTVAPRRPFGREPYPLSGVTLCAFCEAPLLGSATTVAGKYRYRHMRCSTAQRRGKEACRQPMVRAEVIEGQLGAYASDLSLPPESLEEVIAELKRRRTISENDAEVQRLEREIDRWRRLFVLDEIEESRYLSEVKPLRARLNALQRVEGALDLDRVVDYLRDVGSLWLDSPRDLQREFVQEVFERIVVEEREIVTITPKAPYAPFFVVDRHERFGGDFCRLAPRAGLEPTT